MSLAKVPHCRPIEGDPTKKTLLMDKSLIQDEVSFITSEFLYFVTFPTQNPL